jgi:predicted nucleic acid-binding protein
LIHLDTSFLIRALVPNSPEDLRLRGWIAADQEVGISSVAWAQFLCGPVAREARELAGKLLGEPAAFVAEDAASAARLFNASGRRRGSLADCMIAAVAIRLGAPLATSDSIDFRRLAPEGLKLAPA